MTPNPIDCAFAGLPLDRVDEKRGDPNWLEDRKRAVGTRVLPVKAGQPAIQADNGFALAWVSADAANGQDLIFLGLDAKGEACFACDGVDVELANGVAWLEPRSLALRLSADGAANPDLAVAGLAKTLVDWHARHGFCSVCGSQTKMTKGGYSRHCDACGADHFPRVDPVAIMLIVKDDKCVLGRQPVFPPGMYSALAGFIEAGETIEEAVRRETFEESGVRSGRVEYICSQPWPFPSSLMIGCIAEALTEDLRPDETELEDVQWFSKAEIAAALEGVGDRLRVPPPIAIAHQLIRYWSAR